MKAKSNARIAGLAFLLYIVSGMISMAVHDRVHLTEMLSLISSICAIALGVTLYSLTRAQDSDLALLALACRLLEATAGKDAAMFFSVGSTLFCWLLLRGRMIPIGLSTLGMFASLLLVVILPMQRLELIGVPTTWSSSLSWLIWLPMLAFEVAFALLLLTRGIKPPATSHLDFGSGKIQEWPNPEPAPTAGAAHLYRSPSNAKTRP